MAHFIVCFVTVSDCLQVTVIPIVARWTANINFKESCFYSSSHVIPLVGINDSIVSNGLVAFIDFLRLCSSAFWYFERLSTSPAKAVLYNVVLVFGSKIVLRHTHYHKPYSQKIVAGNSIIESPSSGMISSFSILESVPNVDSIFQFFLLSMVWSCVKCVELIQINLCFLNVSNIQMFHCPFSVFFGRLSNM